MIGDALRTDIEQWAARREQNPVFALAKRGAFGRELIAQYLANVTHMVRLTPHYLVLARDAARARGNAGLTEYFQHKLEEEVGHDAWGEADLASLGATGSSQPLPSIVRLTEYLTESIKTDPALYVCYIAWAEYMTVLVGPEFLALIEERNGVSRTSMSVIDKHVVLDIDHSEEALGAIDELVGDPRMIGPMRKALAEIIEIFDSFFSELADLGRKRDESGPNLVAAVVSAA